MADRKKTDIFQLIDKAENEGAKREAMKEAVRLNIGLIFAVVWRYGRYPDAILNPDDLAQEGVLGLIRAVKKFEWRRGFRFSTYARQWVWQFISRKVKKQNVIDRNFIALDERMADSKSKASLSQPSRLEALERIGVSQRIIARTLGYLEIVPTSERNRKIFKLYYPTDGNGSARTYESIGKEFGIKRERVGYICKIIWKKLIILGSFLDPHSFQEELDYIEELWEIIGEEGNPPQITPKEFTSEEKQDLLAKLKRKPKRKKETGGES